MEIWQELKKSKIFENIDESGIKALNFCFKSRLRFVEKNEIIVAEGQQNDYCIYIYSGKVKSVNYDYFGNENIYKTYSTGEVFGLTEAYTSTENYLHSLVATEKCTIILFNRFRFIKPCENHCPRHNQLSKNLTKLISLENLELSNRLLIMSKKTIREKMLTYLHVQSKIHNNSYFDIPYNRKELASFLGVDRCALSIELTKMKNDKLIDFNKNHFHLK